MLFFLSCALNRRIDEYENLTLSHVKLLIKPNGKYKLIDYGRGKTYRLYVEKGRWQKKIIKEKTIIILKAKKKLLNDTLYIKRNDFNKLFYYDTIEPNFYLQLRYKNKPSLLSLPPRIPQ